MLIVGYEWCKLSRGGALPFAMPQKSAPATREQLLAFFDNLERELETVEYFRPADKRDTMLINLRNIFHRMEPTRQDIQTLQGVIMAIAEGRKGRRAAACSTASRRRCCARCSPSMPQAQVPNERAPVRGLARLLRRNPTEAERALWDALTKDRRFAGRGFKRQTPIGRHIADLVSFPLRVVVDLVPEEESDGGRQGRGRNGANGSRSAATASSRSRPPTWRATRPRCSTARREACGLAAGS